MGSFIHYCEHCGAKLNVDDAWKGRVLECPACHKKISFAAEDENKPLPPNVIPDENMPLPPGANKDENMPSAPFIAPANAGNSSGAADNNGAASEKLAHSNGSPRRIRMKPLSTAVSEPSEPNVSLTTQTAVSGDVSPTEEDKTAPVTASAAGPATTMGRFNLRTNTMEFDAPQTQTFAPQTPPRTAPESEPPQKNGKSPYPWGRLGTASVILLALITLLSAGYFTWDIVQEYKMNVELIPEKHQLAKVNKELNEREKSLSTHFKNAVLLLQGTGRIAADGKLDGLQLSEEICRRPDPMPLGVLSAKEMAEVKRILSQYKNSTTRIKEEFVKSFGAIGRLQSSKNNLDSNAILAVSPVVLQAGEIKQNFYAQEQSKLAELKTLYQTLTDIERTLGDELKTNRAKQQELKKARSAAEFVKKQLFPKETNLTIVNTVNNSNGKTPTKDPKADLLAAIKLITSLSVDWQLDAEIKTMEQLLAKVPELQKIFAQKKALLLREACKEIVKIWLTALAIAFALMVLGDVLKAHLDSAEILQRILGKMR
ncbi:MAG: hypothetical protein IKA65_00210 [Lentisphaeria bacterium]|nr:hypothetical protein [Lentisphaeria bacterium]